MPPLPITPRKPSSRITSAWYGSSRIEVVGPAATHFQFPRSSLITTGPQWYRIPSVNLTPAGSFPPSCRYLWTASRPVNKVPLMPTSSPTLRARMTDSDTGVVRLIMHKWSEIDGLVELHDKEAFRNMATLWKASLPHLAAACPYRESVEPFLDIPAGFDRNALPAVSPAHVADADEKRSR